MYKKSIKFIKMALFMRSEGRDPLLNMHENVSFSVKINSDNNAYLNIKIIIFVGSSFGCS
jgi:hypothetical protein